MDAGSLTDVTGLLVGHHHRRGRGWRTGTTVVLAPGGAVAGVDVRGGGPGTRETDLLAPQASINAVHAVCLSGGSAFGLAAADGVMQWLAEHRIGFPVPDAVVPIVPAAVIFDLGRGGNTAHRPDASFGYRAAATASGRPVACGAIGAGTGARAGGLQGGLGGSGTTLASGATVAALAVVNASGRVICAETGLPWEPGALPLRRPSPGERRALGACYAAAVPALNTTIGVIATDAVLTKAECSKLAAVAHDGLARAVRPAHLLFDGDTIFGMSTGSVELPAGDDGRERIGALNMLLATAADCFAAACTSAVVGAASSPAGPPAYRDLCPSAFGDAR
jgi:L-aminopeptidase/D-esterase-like protein